MIDKYLVKKQFNNGLRTYSKAATVQKTLSQELIRDLSTYSIPHHSRLLEVGCGTGFLTQQICETFDYKKLFVNDISLTSKELICELNKTLPNPAIFLEGDAETIDFPNNLDAIISGSTLQWFNNKPGFFNKAYLSLRSKGYLAFSTFGCNNFLEIKNLTGVGLNYHSKKQLVDMLSPQFEILVNKEWTIVKSFETPLEVLRHIKMTGVNGVQKTNFGRKQLRYFTEAYCKKFSNEKNQVHLTYNPILIIAQKR